MMTIMLPKRCIDELHGLQISGDIDDKMKLHVVKWETITKPNLSGGLVLRKFDVKNIACIMKLDWKIISNS